jgi:endonuclease III
MYKREHAVNLDRLKDMGRREVKSYLRSLDGIAPYVADRVTLLCFDAHCVPVDERLHRSLVKAGVGDETVEITDMASWVARQVKAADAVVTHRALQAWADKVGSATGRAASTSAPAKKKKKKTMTTARKKR